MVMVPDVEIRNLVDASGGFACLSVRVLRDISGRDRTRTRVAELISSDIQGGALHHLPHNIPQDQNRSVLVWYSDPEDQADSLIMHAAPYLDTIRELAAQGRDVDEATVKRLVSHTQNVVEAEVDRRLTLNDES